MGSLLPGWKDSGLPPKGACSKQGNAYVTSTRGCVFCLRSSPSLSVIAAASSHYSSHTCSETSLVEVQVSERMRSPGRLLPALAPSAGGCFSVSLSLLCLITQ